MNLLTAPQRRRLLRRRTVRLALAAAIVWGFGTTCAYAYWSASGGGSASVGAGTLQQVTIEAVSIGQNLRPGQTVTVDVQILNTNPFPVDITSMTAGTITSDKPGCAGTSSGVTLNLATVTGPVPANQTTTFAASAAMDTSAPDACQGATLSAPLNLQVRK